MWEVSPRRGLRHALLPLSAMGFEQASAGARPTPSRTHLCCEDVLSRRGLCLPPECACRGAVAGGRTQSSGEKYVPDPTPEAEHTHCAPGIAKDPGEPSVGVRLERSQTPGGPLGGGGLQVGEQSPALVAEPEPARSVMLAEPATVPSVTA